MDPSYEPEEKELRTLYGLKMEQKRNTTLIDEKLFDNVVSEQAKEVRNDHFLITFKCN